jgi:glycosyltransferase involved in cell wall biosynthesis
LSGYSSYDYLFFKGIICVAGAYPHTGLYEKIVCFNAIIQGIGAMLNSEKPDLVTMALLTYNQEKTIAEAVKGVLSQSYSPLEIIISDDCSTDSTFSVIQSTVENYRGPHKTIILRRNETNLGLIDHINSIMEMANGDLIVPAAGDDISLPQRVDRIYNEYMRSNKRALSIFTNAVIIGANTVPKGLIYRHHPSPFQLTSHSLIANLSGIAGCTHAWDRRIFDIFGPMPNDICAEDMVLPFRSSLLGEIHYIDEPLVLYRENPDRVRSKLDLNVYKERMRCKNSYSIKICDCWTSDIETAETFNQISHENSQSLLRKVHHTRAMLKIIEELFDINMFTRLKRLIRMYMYRQILSYEFRWMLQFTVVPLTFVFGLLYLKIRPLINRS